MVRYKSRYGKLEIPMKKSYTREVNGATEFVPGQRIVFNDTIFETDDEKIIEFLDTDPVCVKMQKNQVFAKIEGKVLDAATKEETLEEREARLKKEMEEIKNEKKKATTKEKGKKKKVGKKKDKPVY